VSIVTTSEGFYILRISVAGLLCLSWIASAVTGGLIALRWNHSTEISTSALRVKNIEIIDDKGTSRIALGMERDQPSIRIFSSDRTPLLRFGADRVVLPDSGVPEFLIPTIELNDGHGKPAIQMVGSGDQRGLIAFSSQQSEGKVMLGHFGISDDGTDTGMWGLQINSRLHGKHTDRALGVMTFNGNDTDLVWPRR
jgi:hypothetical protein